MSTEAPLFTAADGVTLAGLGLGLWWSLGGPAWAGLGSLVADELDGRLARALGVYFRAKKVSREELGALWSAPTWLPITAKGMARTELEPVRHFLDGSSAAYEADTGRLVAVYDDPKRGSYFVPQNRGLR